MKSPQFHLPSNPLMGWEDFWYAIRTSKLLIAGVLLATVIGAYLGLQIQDDIYESQARILVKLGRENMDPPVTVATPGVVGGGIRKEEIFTNIILISSRPLIEQTLDEIGVDPALPSLRAGRSLSLSGDALDSVSNDDPASFCEGTESYGADFGTPGAANPVCAS